MKSKNDVEVLINGRKYTICGFESAEYLQKVATYINSKYTEFKNKDYYYSLDMDLRNILLAINIADDYFKADKENQSVVKDNERKDKMVLDMKHEVLESKSRMEKISDKNDELKEQLEEAEKKIVELNVKNQDNSEKVLTLEEKLSSVEAENSANAAKLEAALEKSKKLESENTRLKKKTETLNEKVKAQEGKNTELKKQHSEQMSAFKEKCKAESLDVKKKYENAKSDLVKKYEAAKEELNRKYETGNTEIREKYEKENAELKAKLEAAERRITDLESRNRRGKR